MVNLNYPCFLLCMVQVYKCQSNMKVSKPCLKSDHDSTIKDDKCKRKLSLEMMNSLGKDPIKPQSEDNPGDI